MSRMSELDAAVAELRKCGEALIGVSETLRELFGAKNAAEAEKAAEPALAVIRGYGANRLSEVDSRHYAELLRKAEVL